MRKMRALQASLDVETPSTSSAAQFTREDWLSVYLGVTSVADSDTGYLKIYTDETSQPSVGDLVGSLPRVLRAFRHLTGRSLQYLPPCEAVLPTDLTWSAPVNPGVGATPGHLRLDPAGSSSAVCPSTLGEETVREMASAVAGMVSELLQTQHALRQREAELAAGVPLVARPKEQRHLAERLQAVLKSAAEAVGSQSAALYLLDEATTCLKLRSSWRLPPARFLEQARPLQGALADLEAMLGHAVVLEDTALLEYWNVPEDCRAAACVPVSTATTILGTLWVFNDNPRDFTESQTSILEIVAGRIAVELEREMLLEEGVKGAGLKRQLAAAERIQRNQLPPAAPLLQGWDVAGWTDQVHSIGGDFYDWFCLPDGLSAIAVGSATDQGIPAALVANNVKTALRAHAQYHREPGRLLRQVNLTLWTGSAGDQTASLFCGLADTATGRIAFASAGQTNAILLQPDGWQSLVRPSVCLGESPEAEFHLHRVRLRPGEALLLFTSGCRETGDQPGHPLKEVALADLLAGNLSLPAKELTALARDRFEALNPARSRQDRAILVIRRSDP